MSPTIQFPCRKGCLRNRVKADVKRSSHPTLTKYMNGLIELVLALPYNRGSSYIDELTYVVTMFYSLPVSQINALAQTQNRNFEQMLRHLLEISMAHYPVEMIANEISTSRAVYTSDLKLPPKDTTRDSLVSPPTIRFPCHDPSLRSRVKADVKRSSYSTLTKYMNGLIELVLALPYNQGSSYIDELTYVVTMFYSLPVSQINALAQTQNRNFEQMLRHLLEISMTHYPVEAVIDELPISMALYTSDLKMPRKKASTLDFPFRSHAS